MTISPILSLNLADFVSLLTAGLRVLGGGCFVTERLMAEKEPWSFFARGAWMPFQQVSLRFLLFSHVADKKSQRCRLGELNPPLPSSDLGVFLVFPNQCQQMFHSFFFGNVMLYAYLLAVERYLPGACAYISVVGIGHLSGAVYDATHDTDLESFHVAGGCLDLCNGLAKLIECASAPRTGDVFGFGGAQSGGLEDSESGLLDGLGG